jgi:hypothetical protein
MGRGLTTELLLRKDGGKVGHIEDTKTCVGMEVCGCTGGGQSWKRTECSTGLAQYRLVLGAISKGGGVWSTDHVCKNAGARTWVRMGSCVWCCWAGLLCCHGTVLCRGGGALGSSGAAVYAEALNRVGRTVYSCVHLCTQGALGRTGSR